MIIPKNTYYFKRLLIPIIITFLYLSCKKSSTDDTIPNVPVSFTVYLSLPQFVTLNSIGGYVTIPEYGYRGIIVYRRSQDEFVAFDQACPYDPTVQGAKIVVDSSGITTIDPKCGSKFNLYDGSVLHGPATRPMKSYNSVFDSGTNSVYISN